MGGLLLFGTIRVASYSHARVTHDHSTHEHSVDRHAEDGDGGHPHQGDDGLTLAAGPHAAATPGGGCGADQPVRSFDVVATDVVITLNRFLDHDPRGRLFALEEDLERVRAEEAANEAARAAGDETAVSVGLQGDAIQPLVLRVHPGDCLRLTLRNVIGEGAGEVGPEPASIDLHGGALRVVGGGPAISTNPAATAAPGETVAYEWSVPAGEPSATHYFHSHGDERLQTAHGLFGAIVVEPAGSSWVDPRHGEPLTSGWDAIVQRADGTSFREFALLYHEIGDETYILRDAAGAYLPIVDPLTDAYRPGSRALNYRSEPFMNRLALGEAETGQVDKSLAYSSYAYGDPATPILRTEVGDPTVQRVVHAGSETFHVHHVHGGSVRWPRQPGAENAPPIAGLAKDPPLVPEVSERTDAQSIGPSETFDVHDECTAGGCQQSPGDVMYHCHVAHHYVSGMWGVWRVYNTRQEAGSTTDTMVPLLPLPDRVDALAAAVNSSALIDSTVDFHGEKTRLEGDQMTAHVERHLPPQGVPKGYDASVWDWVWDGDVARGEPETTARWPNFVAAEPRERPPILFDPRTGKPAFPVLRPHLARRPPFPRDNGPAPYLDPPEAGAARPRPPPPGANGPASLCPAGTRVQDFPINAVETPVALNERLPITDPKGLLFVLREERDRVRADPAAAQPLTIRANATEDCVDILLRSEIPDDADEPFSKISLHVHHVQFDIQGSDGVPNGFNFEQSIRPYEAEGLRLTAPVSAGDTTLPVPGAHEHFSVGTAVGVGLDEDGTFEEARVVAVDSRGLTLAAPLEHDHATGAVVGTEYLRHRWFPDAQFGTAYFHDHVDAIHSWRHGLSGALIVEPPGSRYTDPETGDPVRSGAVADITTDSPVSLDIDGSFREVALGVQDDNPLSRLKRSSGSALGLRVEPLDRRPGNSTDVFRSEVHGEPVTPVIDAVLGDPVVLRTLVGATNDVHTLHVDGHRFRVEPWSPTSPLVSTVRVGISERFDLSIAAAGGPRRQPGDYLIRNGRHLKLAEGSWGLLRVHEPDADDRPRALDGVDPVEPIAGVCPAGAPRRVLRVDAVTTALPMLGRHPGRAFVHRPVDDTADVASATPPEPFVAHANVGECVKVDLANRTGVGPVSFHVDGLAFDPSTSAGVGVGREPRQAVDDGESGTFEFYAAPEFGQVVAMVTDQAEPVDGPADGLYGAIVVGAPGTTYEGEGTHVVAHPPDAPPYRDATLFLHDEDAGIGTHRMPYSPGLEQTAGINYRLASMAPGPDAEPETPMLHAIQGDPIRLHVLAPVSEQVGVFTVEGHAWDHEPGLAGTNRLGGTAIGGLEALTLDLVAGPAGPGDYVYGAQRGAHREAGMWGVLRVVPEGDPSIGPLRASRNQRDRLSLPLLAGLGVLFALGVVGVRGRSNRRS